MVPRNSSHRRIRHAFGRHTRNLAVALSLLGLCSCSAGRRTAVADPFQQPGPAVIAKSEPWYKRNPFRFGSSEKPAETTAKSLTPETIAAKPAAPQSSASAASAPRSAATAGASNPSTPTAAAAAEPKLAELPKSQADGAQTRSHADRWAATERTTVQPDPVGQVTQVSHSEIKSKPSLKPDQSLPDWAAAKPASAKPLPAKPAAATGTGAPLLPEDFDRRAATFTPAEPRVPLGKTFDPELTHKLAHDAGRAPDEYLFDGGARGSHEGRLATEDTVAEYVDHVGEPHLKPTNRVAVYSPQFGAVRSSSGPHSDVAVDRLASANDVRLGAGLQTRTAAGQQQKAEATGGMLTRSRASGMESPTVAGGVAHAATAGQHVKLQNVFQDLSFVQTGQMLQADKARLAAAMQAARAWSTDHHPVISAHTSGANQVYASFTTAEMVGLDDGRRTKGDLRIVKLADRLAAEPGEIVTFTIRYDNVGDFELYSVRISDNLTPRLEYVEDSATSDRDGQLVIEENGEGSLILRFEVAEPLPGHKGGVVTFQARVR